jgi:hypothetical protein
MNNNEIMKRFLIDFFIILPIGFLVGTLAYYGATRLLVYGHPIDEWWRPLVCSIIYALPVMLAFSYTKSFDFFVKDKTKKNNEKINTVKKVKSIDQKVETKKQIIQKKSSEIILDLKTKRIILIIVLLVIVYFIISPYHSCKRGLGNHNTKLSNGAAAYECAKISTW